MYNKYYLVNIKNTINKWYTIYTRKLKVGFRKEQQ